MKLKTLTIHNIASIEDAFIDFEAKPLSDSELFLITGKTGSGKSTILDAICLALFGDTPRLDKTSMQGATDEIQVDDPRQLLRKNTGEGFVCLSFIGNNTVPYEAKWGVKRAHNKPGGKLQSKSWNLKNLDSNDEFTKDNDIRAELKKAIGEGDFQQFCKTNLLAQGDFTKFLDSKDEEKAGILEKITGMDIYSKIGTKIFNIWDQKKKVYEELTKEIEGIMPMSDEEIAQHNQKIKDLESKIKEDEEKKKVLSDKAAWIKHSNELAVKTDKALEDYNALRSETESDDFKAEQSLVKNWNETIEIRQSLSENNSSKKQIQDLATTLSNKEKVYSTLSSGKLYLEDTISSSNKDLEEAKSYLNTKQDKAEIYSNAQGIETTLENIAKSQKKISEQEKIVKDNQVLLDGELKEKLNNTKSVLSSSVEDLNTKNAKIEDLEKDLEKTGLTSLRQQKENIVTKLGEIKLASTHLSSLREKIEAFKKQAKKIEEDTNTIDGKHKELTKLNDSLIEARAKKDVCDDLLKKQEATVKNWAKEYRRSLKSGDVCPVCLQRIESELPHEDVLDTLLMEAQKAAEDAKKEFEKIEGNFNKLDSEIKVLTTQRNNAVRSHAQDTSVSDAEGVALTSLSKVGIASIDDNTETELDKLAQELTKKQDKIAAEIKEGEKIETALKNERDAKDKLQKAKETAEQNVHNAEDAIKTCKNGIDLALATIEQNKDAISTSEKFITGTLASTSWENDWKVDPERFKQELSAEKVKFNSLSTEKVKIEKDLEGKKALLNNVRASLDGVVSLMPSWKEIKASQPSLVESLSEKAVRLLGEVKSAIDQTNAAESTRKTTETAIEEFLRNNITYTLETLESLQSYSSGVISAKNDKLVQKEKELQSQKAVYNTALDEVKEHQDKKPEILEGETEESLNQMIETLSEEVVSSSKSQGEIQQKLKVNSDKVNDLGEKIKAQQAAKEIYNKWDRLKNLFGDSSGKTFRKIAQSYILEGLIHSANHYMRSLSDRYTLKIVPGSFVIYVVDAYQGYAERAASTISGGESFLVSLSLALALSDIGKDMSVNTLFIDEGFGTLSGEPLQNAINTLKSLHKKSGRHVGIISHIDELQQKIPVQIRVEQEGTSSSSTIKVIPEE